MTKKPQVDRTVFDELKARMLVGLDQQRADAIAQLDAVATIHAILTSLGVDVTLNGYTVKDGKPPTTVYANTFTSNQSARVALADIISTTGFVSAGICTCDASTYIAGGNNKGEVTAKLIGPIDEISLSLRFFKEPPEGGL